MLKDLVEKVDNVYEQIGNFSGEVKTTRKSLMEMPYTHPHPHTHAPEIKNYFDGFGSRLDPAEVNRNYSNCSTVRKK